MAQDLANAWRRTPKLTDVKWLYATNWYDYFLSGWCQYQGKHYYAVCMDEVDGGPWQYVVIDLPEDAWKQEQERHDCFAAKYGHYWDFDPDTGKRGEQKYNPEAPSFYDRYPAGEHKQDEYLKNYPAIGWFED